MWNFYVISLSLTLGMVILTLKYFASPYVPRYVFFIVGYAWFCSLSIIILVPADIWTTIIGHYSKGISFFWSLSYWSTFLLTWAVVPLLQGYEDAGDFTMTERLKTSIHVNLVFYLTVGSFALFGLILLISMRKNWTGGVLGFAMACSNTFGLVTGAFLLGFGLSEIPRSLWKNADWTFNQKVLSHKIAKMAVKLDEAHQNFSNSIVIAQATSNQMSKRDPLRPYMDVIDKMIAQMLREDPSFKPQGGQLGENDMDYDTDEKSMAALRRQLRVAWEKYQRYKSEYMACVLEALELEDTIKNYEHIYATGWKYVSTLRGTRSGALGSILNTIEAVWRCILSKQLQRLSAIVLGCMSAAILLAEATLLPNVDLSLFSILIRLVRKQEVLVQRMGNIDDAVPFFGRSFNKIYPLIMVIYTLLVASNFFDRVIDFFGSWNRFRFKKEADNMDGFDHSGMIILQKERAWLEQGHKVGEQVIPLARNFNSVSLDDVESNIHLKANSVEMKAANSSSADSKKGSISKEETRRYTSNREAISNKYAAVREEQIQQPPSGSKSSGENNIASAKVSLLSERGSTSVLASKWQSMKMGFQNFKANIEAKKFIPLRQTPEIKLDSQGSSSQSLDEIFQRLKHPSIDHGIYGDDGEDDGD